MHTFGPFLQKASGENLVYALAINGIFNMGVTLFMLISGYFGIKRSWKKFWKLYGVVILYSILGFCVVFAATGEFSLKELVYSLFPISTNKYWYITSYLLIFIIAPYLNNTLEKISRKEYGLLLLVLCWLFYVAPTVLYKEIMQDGGKGVVNLVIVYMIGRYIRLYKDDWHMGKLKILAITASVLLLGIVLNYVCIVYLHHGEWMAPFSRDCSLIILFGSILVFMLFKEIAFYNSIINKIAISVFPLYIFEGALRKIVNAYGWLSYHESGFYVDITLCVLAIMAIVVVVDNIRLNIQKGFLSLIREG